MLLTYITDNCTLLFFAGIAAITAALFVPIKPAYQHLYDSALTVIAYIHFIIFVAISIT